MTGTLRITENKSNTWARNVDFAGCISRFQKLGSVKVTGNKIRTVRFCGSIITAEFFPNK